MRLSRVPVESPAPVAPFALLRLAIAVAALASVIAFDVPDRTELLVLAGAVALPWAGAIVISARTRPELALNPLIAIIDLAILAAVELLVPQTYAGVRFLVVFLVAAHAHFQGPQRGLALGVLATAVFIPIAAFGDPPLSGGLLAFCEVLFAASVLSAGLFMGRLRTAESTGRLRARELSRRAIEAEAAVRRRIAEAIHDGPVQELVSLDMMLNTARRAIERGDPARATELLEDARMLTERNIGALRDEIVGLGPYAFDELTLDVALEQCVPTWARRYQLDIGLTLDRYDLSNDVCGSLFGIAQEAVANAGRHAGAKNVSITLRTVEHELELRISDDGHGFEDEIPLGPNEPGHLGLASMRERAELVGGRLEIRSSGAGSTVIVRVPLAEAFDRRDGRRVPAPR